MDPTGIAGLSAARPPRRKWSRPSAWWRCCSGLDPRSTVRGHPSTKVVGTKWISAVLAVTLPDERPHCGMSEWLVDWLRHPTLHPWNFGGLQPVAKHLRQICYKFVRFLSIPDWSERLDRTDDALQRLAGANGVAVDNRAGPRPPLARAAVLVARQGATPA